ncbi:50S ribosomal protein L34e [Candidatus Micrarchaeota archaeon]|nr:50S ribosomal protein L34e [Candidatus Micrarchaeota archaeon]
MKRSVYRLKKRQRKTPSGNHSQIRKNKKPTPATCALCRQRLNAVLNHSRALIRKTAATARRPQRVFGGVLCANCTRHVVKTKTRLAHGADEKAVPLTLLKYVRMLK